MHSFLRTFRRDRRGASAVEFALIGPVFCLIFAGAVDIGSALFTKMKLDAAVAAGVNYAQVNAASVTAANGATLAQNIASVVATSQGTGWADDTVVVNNGPQTAVTAGAAVNSGTAANADQCYCPTGTTASLTWGTSRTCASACPSGGGYAGKFVTISASRAYTPIFSTYGLVSTPMTARATVQVQ